jgi:DNA repair protein RadC
MHGPRERAIDVGIEGLGDADLIAILLGTGGPGHPVAAVAGALVQEVGLAGLAREGIGGFAERPGIGRAKGARLAAAVELGRRVAADSLRASDLRFGDARAVDSWARPRLAPLEHEELWVLALDGQNGLKAARRVAAGGIHGLHVAPRDPLRAALREAASAFVLVHNHPSGAPAPSDEDLDFTARIADAADQVGTPLLDHVIVGRDGYASLLDRGALRR